MKKILFVLCISTLAFAQTTLEYKEKYESTLWKKFEKLHKTTLTAENKITQKIKEQAPEADTDKLYASIEGINIPASQEVFETVFHFPPKHQGYTASCWAQTGVSFIESEVKRLENKEIKLSVMSIVYWEYLEKARYYIQTRGESALAKGSQINGVFRIADSYGILPEAVYPGNPTKFGLDIMPLFNELKSYLSYLKQNAYWDEATALPAITAILDKHLGTMPKAFDYEEKKYSPKQFYTDILKFNTENYTALQSTLQLPFYSWTEFKFPDNWSHEQNYYNLPIDDFYAAIVSAVKSGHTVGIGGDTSEPGYNLYHNIAFIPAADIPVELIDQDVREYRIFNGTTGDDHGVHIVGYKQINGIDWFLIKDSSLRSAYYNSKHPGYYFYRGDYIRLKMLTAVVGKEFIED